MASEKTSTYLFPFFSNIVISTICFSKLLFALANFMFKIEVPLKDSIVGSVARQG